MPSEQFLEVIIGPAERVTSDGRPLRFAPGLVDQLLSDCREGGDTLPLLSLTLAQLYENRGASEELTLAHYANGGGLRSIVQTVVDEILDDDPAIHRRQLDDLRDAFVPWLATVNPDTDQPMRRVARRSEIPEASRSVVDAFVAYRLLISDLRDNEEVIEVALESLLWLWDDLATWLNDAWRELKALEDLERTAAAWEHNGRHPAWLLSGVRLQDAETLAEAPTFRARLTTARDFLAAARHAALADATSARLVVGAKEMLAGTRSGGDTRACLQLLAADLLSRTVDQGVLYDAQVCMGNTVTIVRQARGPSGSILTDDRS